MKNEDNSTPKERSHTWSDKSTSCDWKEHAALSAEEQRKASLQPNKKDYQGPLYAPHPDIKK